MTLHAMSSQILCQMTGGGQKHFEGLGAQGDKDIECGAGALPSHSGLSLSVACTLAHWLSWALPLSLRGAAGRVRQRPEPKHQARLPAAPTASPWRAPEVPAVTAKQKGLQIFPFEAGEGKPNEM